MEYFTERRSPTWIDTKPTRDDLTRHRKDAHCLNKMSYRKVTVCKG